MGHLVMQQSASSHSRGAAIWVWWYSSAGLGTRSVRGSASCIYVYPVELGFIAVGLLAVAKAWGSAVAKRTLAQVAAVRCVVCVLSCQYNEDYPIGEVLWPMIRASPAMQAKCRFRSQLPESDLAEPDQE